MASEERVSGISRICTRRRETVARQTVHPLFKAQEEERCKPEEADSHVQDKLWSVTCCDLTPLQQERKNAAWPAFQDYNANGMKTQWRAEKLYVIEGDHFVQHKVVTVCMI